MKKTMLLAFLLATCGTNALADTRLEIITAEGVVSFIADDSWPVLTMQTKPPVSAVVFQIPNAADEGTPHSTNLVLRLFDRSPAAREAFEAPIAQVGTEPASVEARDGWVITRQTGFQADTPYVILDAKRAEVGDVSASVRLAWPRLPGNTATYDAEMEALFGTFIGAITGSVAGPRKPGS